MQLAPNSITFGTYTSIIQPSPYSAKAQILRIRPIYMFEFCKYSEKTTLNLLNTR